MRLMVEFSLVAGLVLVGQWRCHLFSAQIAGNFHVVTKYNDGVGCQSLFEHNFPHGIRHNWFSFTTYTVNNNQFSNWLVYFGVRPEARGTNVVLTSDAKM